jgi:hypothetical protein
MRTHRTKRKVGVTKNGNAIYAEFSQLLIKRVVLRIIVPSQNHREVITMRAKKGEYWKESQVDRMLMDSACEARRCIPRD